jgi:hypothetical protein
MSFGGLPTKKMENFCQSYSLDLNLFRTGTFESLCHLFASSFGASEATIFSKRGSPRSGSQNGNSFNCP